MAFFMLNGIPGPKWSRWTGFEHRGTGQTWITMNQATNEGVLYINQTTGGGNNNADSGLVILGHGTYGRPWSQAWPIES